MGSMLREFFACVQRGEVAGYASSVSYEEPEGYEDEDFEDEPDDAGEYDSDEDELEQEEANDEDLGGAQDGPLTAEQITALKKRMKPTRFPDPRLGDAGLKGLIEKKHAARDSVLATLDKPEVTWQEILPLLDKFKSFDGQIETAQKQMNARGVKLKALSDEYKDEDKKLGEWRVFKKEDGESKEQFEARKKQLMRSKHNQNLVNSEFIVTRRLNDEQHQDARLDVGPDGQVVGKQIQENGVASGALEYKAGSRAEYVLDKDGQLNQFLGRSQVGKDLVINGKQVTQTINMHHSSITCEAVGGAGVMEFDDAGKISELSNASGHYKPGVAEMIQTVETLLKQGFLLDKTWVDAQGNAPTGAPAALAQKACELEKRLFETSLQVREMARDLGKIRDPKQSEAKQDEILKLSKWFDNQTSQLNKAKQVLAKLGIAPSNRISDAKVAFIDGAGAKAGHEIRLGGEEKAKSQAVDVETFLQSGGGTNYKTPEDDAATKRKAKAALKAEEKLPPEEKREAQEKRMAEEKLKAEKNRKTEELLNAEKKLNAKGSVLEELKEKMQGEREWLDFKAEKRAEKVARKLAELEKRLSAPLPEGLNEEQRQAAESVRENFRRFRAQGADPTEKQLTEMAEVLNRILNPSAPPVNAANAAPAQPAQVPPGGTGSSNYTKSPSTAPGSPPQPSSSPGYTKMAPTATADALSDDDFKNDVSEDFSDEVFEDDPEGEYDSEEDNE